MTLRRALPWLILAVIGWGYVLWLGARMFATDPPTAGFDLALLTEAARRTGAGMSPYDPALIEGASVAAPSLFYSYPPPVAQAMRVLAWMPDALVLLVWGIAATSAAVLVGVAIARRFGSPRTTAELVLPMVAVLPLVLPFSVALLFGNLNVWFPALYGLMLLAAAPSPTVPANDRWTIGGGVALAVAALAKLHPASLGVWFLVRGWVPGGAAAGRSKPTARQVVLVAIATGLGIVAVSLLLGGAMPWSDYIEVVRAGTGADLVDPRNAAPASLVASVIGADAMGVRLIQAVVSIGAVTATAYAAWRVADPLTAFAVAAVASLMTLPVTWFHYPVALIPFAIAALARAGAHGDRAERFTTGLVGAAFALSIVAIAWLPLLWVAIALLLVAIVRSGRT